MSQTRKSPDIIQVVPDKEVMDKSVPDKEVPDTIHIMARSSVENTQKKYKTQKPIQDCPGQGSPGHHSHNVQRLCAKILKNRLNTESQTRESQT